MDSPQSPSSIEIANLGARMDDLKWYVGVFATVISVLFSAFAIFFGLNLSSERASLKEYKDSLRQEVLEAAGKAAAQPNLILETKDRKQLESAQVEAKACFDENKQPQLSFEIVLRNTGKARTGPLFAKYYSTDFLLDNAEVDGTGYKTETFISPDKFVPNELFGGVSMTYTVTLQLKSLPQLSKGGGRMLIRYFYGSGQIVESQVRLIASSRE